MIAMIYCKIRFKLQSQDLERAQNKLHLDIRALLLRVMLVASGFLPSIMESGSITSLISQLGYLGLCSLLLDLL